MARSHIRSAATAPHFIRPSLRYGMTARVPTPWALFSQDCMAEKKQRNLLPGSRPRLHVEPKSCQGLHPTISTISGLSRQLQEHDVHLRVRLPKCGAAVALKTPARTGGVCRRGGAALTKTNHQRRGDQRRRRTNDRLVLLAREPEGLFPSASLSWPVNPFVSGRNHSINPRRIQCRLQIDRQAHPTFPERAPRAFSTFLP